MKKKTVTVFVVILMVLSIFSYLYFSERKQCNEALAGAIEMLNYDVNKSFFNEDFKNSIKKIRSSYKIRTNSEIKSLTNEIVELYNSNKCYKDEFIQLSDIEIQNEVNELISTTEDYGVGKLFVYTNHNYGDVLTKEMGYVDCYVYAYGLTDNLIEDLEAKIKIRGNSTAFAPKKPYNIKFSEKVDLYGFGEAKKWSFLAEYYDPTMLRNNIFLNFAQELGLDYTSNCKYVEIWLDGNYNGCYLLAESVETGKNRVNIDVENGDFLIEYEASREEEDVTYITTEHGLRFAMSDPEELDENAYNTIKQKIDEFDSTIYSNDFNKIENLLDVKSFTKLFLVNQYAKTLDFGFSSVNFYYKEGKFYAGPVWDFDRSSGNASFYYTNYWTLISDSEDGELDYISYQGLDNWLTEDGYGTNKVFVKLYEYPEFKNKVKELFNEYRSYMQSMYQSSGIIDQLINDYGQLILNNYASKKVGGAGWRFSGLAGSDLVPFTNYEDNVAYLKSWLEKRYEYLDKAFNQ